MLEKLLTQLIDDLELESIAPKDENQTFHLAINPELTLSFKELNPGVLLFSSLGDCPAENREDLFLHLMKANLLGQGTGGGAIGLNAEEKLLTLSLALPYDMNERAFKEKVEDFANFTDYWKEELIRYRRSLDQSTLS